MFDAIAEWFAAHQSLVYFSAGGSLVVSLVGVAMTYLLLARIPADYFIGRKAHAWGFGEHHPVVRLILIVVKNVLGFVLVVAGIIMIPLPGPGVVTLLLGLLLMNVPGKRKAEQWLIRRQWVFNSVNAIRRSRNQPPLVYPQAEPTEPPG